MNLAVALEAFHFLRPLALLLLPMIALLWWLARRRVAAGPLVVEGLAPHLRDALSVGGRESRRILPIDLVALGLVLAVLGAAGPTWSRVPDPFVAQTAPVVIALKVAPSMETDDVAPSRLERAKQKIRDLVELRAGARTALVAYGGTAHSVVPMTEDANVLHPYLQGLLPEVMPDEGDNAEDALAMARDILAGEQTPGGILLVTDTPAPPQPAPDDGDGTAADSLAVLAVLPEGSGGDAGDVPVVRVTPDDADIRALDRSLNAAYQRALTEDGTQPWDDRGWVLAWPAAFVALFWFRRGWTMRWVILLTLAGGMTPANPARADGIADWFLTPDQQGRLAYQRKEFDVAAERFTDPMWKAFAMFRDGQYEAAAEAFHRIETPEASFAEGLAHIRSRAYRDGIAAYETTLERDPDFPGAAENLETAKRILDYVETTREQSDTGENTGEGADDIVFDNEEARGADTQIEASEDGEGLLTADQWMNTVDTQTGDFLRQRFAIEAARR
ncbi:VWA domain-containing protein [Sulfitobacter sp. D35]|uniref:VWA domain-containing protein n=1 Tax=Sulfitobacter sp. D35 TaxID=3083252 RepID=UPI00296FB13A|nr:VWA domain-containing protein [Sulfitobacter sp. D35]MDW4497359.1 VWA domain-containing protein [Sulfitobacter sp. D35]